MRLVSCWALQLGGVPDLGERAVAPSAGAAEGVAPSADVLEELSLLQMPSSPPEQRHAVSSNVLSMQMKIPRQEKSKLSPNISVVTAYRAVAQPLDGPCLASTKPRALRLTLCAPNSKYLLPDKTRPPSYHM